MNVSNLQESIGWPKIYKLNYTLMFKYAIGIRIADKMSYLRLHRLSLNKQFSRCPLATSVREIKPRIAANDDPNVSIAGLPILRA